MDLDKVCKDHYNRRATKIQALVRGRQIRKKFFPYLSVKDFAAQRIQALARGRQTRARLFAPSKDHAAQRIQSLVRGNKVRQSFDFRPTDKTAIKRYSAQKIQALGRGYLARKNRPRKILPNPYRKAQVRVHPPIRPAKYFTALRAPVPPRPVVMPPPKSKYTYYVSKGPKPKIVNPYAKKSSFWTKFKPYRGIGNPYLRR